MEHQKNSKLKELSKIEEVNENSLFNFKLFIESYKKYKDVFKNLVISSLKVKYKDSVLGFFWTFLEPLLIAMTFYFVFTTLFKSDLVNYGAYILIGFTVWFFFSNTTNDLNLFVKYSNLLKNIYVPKFLLILVSSIVVLINVLFSFLVLLIFLIIIGIKPTTLWFYLPLLILLNYIFNLGFLMILSSSFVFLRDLDKIWNVLNQVWFFLTPIVYPQSLILKISPMILSLNPIFYYVKSYRKILLYGKVLSFNYWIILVFFSTTFFLIGWMVFSKNKSRISDEI